MPFGARPTWLVGRKARIGRFGRGECDRRFRDRAAGARACCRPADPARVRASRRPVSARRRRGLHRGHCSKSAATAYASGNLTWASAAEAPSAAAKGVQTGAHRCAADAELPREREVISLSQPPMVVSRRVRGATAIIPQEGSINGNEK